MRVSSYIAMPFGGSGANLSGRTIMNARSSAVRFGVLDQDKFDSNVGDVGEGAGTPSEKDLTGGEPETRRRNYEEALVSRINVLRTQIAEHVQQHHHEKIRELMLEKLNLQQELFGCDNLETAYTLASLGENSMDLEDGNKALKYYATALKVCQKNPGPAANNLTIMLLESLGDAYRKLGDLVSAEAEYAAALQMALDETVEKGYEPAPDVLMLSLMDVLLDERNPRQAEVDILAEDPATWLQSRVPPSTVH